MGNKVGKGKGIKKGQIMKKLYNCIYIFVIFITALSFFGCSNKDANKVGPDLMNNETSTEIQYVDIDTRIREMTRPTENEIKALGDSLYEADGDTIIGDIHFKMSKNEYKKAYKKLMKDYSGRFYIMCNSLHSFYIDSIVPSFHNGKLWEVSFYGLTDDNVDARLKEENQYSFDSLKEFFIRKYGVPHNFSNNILGPGLSRIEWVFQHRSIYIISKYNGYKINGMVISDPTPNLFIIFDTQTRKIIDEEDKIYIDEVRKKLGKEIEERKKIENRKKKLQQSL